MWFHIIITDNENREYGFDVFADNLIEAGVIAEQMYEQCLERDNNNNND